MIEILQVMETLERKIQINLLPSHAAIFITEIHTEIKPKKLIFRLVLFKIESNSFATYLTRFASKFS